MISVFGNSWLLGFCVEPVVGIVELLVADGLVLVTCCVDGLEDTAFILFIRLARPCAVKRIVPSGNY